MTDAHPSMSRPPSRQTPVLVLALAILVAVVKSVHAESAPTVTVTIVEAPKSVPASAGFSLRVRVVNTGSVPVRACVVETAHVLTEQPCIILGYRFLNPPRHLNMDGVDTAQLMPAQQILAPSEGRERHVWLYASRRSQSGVLHLYVITSAGGRLTWGHQPLPITITSPPWRVRRRELVTWTIFGIYLLGVAWGLARMIRSALRSRGTPCSF